MNDNPIEEYENSLLSNAMAMRHRDPPKNEAEIKDASDEIVRRIKIIDRWYAQFHGDIWARMKIESHDMVEKILSAGDSIDSTYEKFRMGKVGWNRVEKAIDAYGETWRIATRNFLKAK
jgi:hypothetical protein